MTNTRLTDPEVLEARYPIRLVQFSLRRGSGGAGQWRGGDGVIRTIEFLESVELSLLTSRRGRYAPFGLAGGLAAKIGSNTLITAAGVRSALEACCQLTVNRGDQLEIQTPGGGGYGIPS
jgi:5-oxoprolinase (ATP-hydrolysing)